VTCLLCCARDSVPADWPCLLRLLGQTTHVSGVVSARAIYQEIVVIFDQKKAAGDINQDQVVPSLDWFYLSFALQHPGRAAAARSVGCLDSSRAFAGNQTRAPVLCRYTGRFDIIRAVLARDYRPNNIDARYCAKLQRNAKNLAVLHREHCNLISLDDKCGIVVGDPGKAVAAAERGRKVLVRRGEGAVQVRCRLSAG
jgi:hypothetical protein